MTEKFTMKNEQVVLTGMVMRGEEGEEFFQWMTKRVALFINVP